MKTRLVLTASLVALTVAGAGATGWRIMYPTDKLALGKELSARGELRPALLALREAVIENPQAAEPHYRLGLLDLLASDPVAAEKELLAARDRGWAAAAIKLPLAEALLSQGRYADLLHDFAVEPEGAADAPGLLVMRAQAELGLHRLDAASADAAEAQLLDPRLGQAALVSARVKLARKDVEGATESAERAVKLMPDSVEALALLGEMRLATGDQAAALQWFAKAAAAPSGSLAIRARVELRQAELLVRSNDPGAPAAVNRLLAQQPKQPLGKYLKAVLQAQAKDWKAADNTLVSAGTALDSVPGAAYLTAIVKTKVDQPQQAINAAELAVAQAPTDALAARLLAGLYLNAKQPRQAIPVLVRAAAAAPSDAATLVMLAQAYAASGAAAQMQPVLAKIRVAAPDDPQILTQVAALQAASGASREAERTLEHALDVIPAVAMREPDNATTAAAGADAAMSLVMLALQSGDVDRADEGVQRLRTLRGAGDVQAILLDGLVKMARMDVANARAAFDNALRLDPSSIPAHLDLARLQSQTGESQEALATLQQVLDENPANVAALSGKADILFALGRSDEAVAALEAGHIALKADAALTAQLSDAYVRVRSPAKALPMLEDALASGTSGLNKTAADRDAVLLLSAKVRAQEALGQRQEAIATARDVLARVPGNVALRVQIADKLGAQSDWAGAARLLADGLALQPGNPALVEGVALAAMKSGGSAAGLARADQLLADPANAGMARILKGDLLMSAGDHAGAAASFEANIAADGPTDVVLRAARARMQAGQADRARSVLQSWLATHPDATEAWITLATIDLGADRISDAKTEFERGHAAQSNNGPVLNNYAWVLQQTGDLGQARTLANRAWLLSPSPKVADTFGWILLLGGDREGAVPLLRQAAGALRDDATVQQHLATALAQAGPVAAPHSATP